MKKSELLDRFKYHGIPIPEDPKTTNRTLEKLLGIDYYNKHPEIHTWGLYKRLFELHSPQLCFSFKELKPIEQEEILKSEDWVAETKLDGCRIIIYYSPEFGFEFFSRDISEVTFLPNCYTDKILLIQNGIIKHPQSYIGTFRQSFILDAEVIIEGKNLDNTNRGGGFSITELNATVSILGSHSERAKNIQLAGNSLKFFVFDILEFNNKSLLELPYRNRRSVLERLLLNINNKVPFEFPESTISNKQEFFDRIVANNGEGIVIKNMNASYHATTSRRRDVQVKMKRTLSGSKHEDIDCFISGAIPPKKNSILSVQNLIGGVKVSCYIEELDGTLTEHWLATISGITDSLRRKMTALDSMGNPILNDEYLNKVLIVDGQDISSKNLRVSHARSNFNFRIDKSPEDCIITREFLEDNIC